ncbi:hypothetical protein AMATHDRAFT_49020 [Amanita thiersii Skay4041]|uniref:Uncharacterized protein n=1 Tax=Amanita thiersii Skay4041 TaxID=703135 RepID=A0A2A9NMS2_9AGAR|nr:hypothetical protein AMATHDRAFT_49020 [Amanita thiersii Skay4041]
MYLEDSNVSVSVESNDSCVGHCAQYEVYPTVPVVRAMTCQEGYVRSFFWTYLQMPSILSARHKYGHEPPQTSTSSLLLTAETYYSTMKFIAPVIAVAALLVPFISAADCVIKPRCSACETKDSMDAFVTEYCSQYWNKFWFQNKGAAYVISTPWNYDFQCENALKNITDSCYDTSRGGVINDAGSRHMTLYFCTCID